MENISKNIIRGLPASLSYSEDERIEAWQKLQFGMFIHWGLYSKLGGVWQGENITEGYNEQIQMWANISHDNYGEIAKSFNPVNYSPKEICRLAKDAGMKYIVITSKHHDGFAMFDTASTDYNIVASSPYKRDPLKELADECRKQGLKFGLYFSLVDWNQGHDFDGRNSNPIPESMEALIEEQLRELMKNYGPIAEVWFDMSSPTMAQSRKFSKIVRELQPEAVINSRIFNNMGDFRTLGDNEIPKSTLDGPWQTPASIYHSTWGYRSWQERDDFDGKVKDLVIGLASITARGGSYLLNIGPRGDGSIVEFEAEVLRAIGSWLKRHPHAVIGAKASLFGGQSWGEVTIKDQELFLLISKLPEDRKIVLRGIDGDVIGVVEYGYDKTLDFEYENNNLTIFLKEELKDPILPVIKVSLKDKPRIIPEKIFSLDMDKGLSIGHEDLYLGKSVADEGNYFDINETTVRITSYIAAIYDGKVSLRIKGIADPSKIYKISLGEKSYEIEGKDLMDNDIGPFELEASKLSSLDITLAKRDYPTEDLGLKITCIDVF